MQQLPQPIIDNLLEIASYLAAAAIGFIARLLQKLKKDKENG